MTTTALPMSTTVYPLTWTANTHSLTSPNQGTAGKHVSLPNPQKKKRKRRTRGCWMQLLQGRWEMGQFTFNPPVLALKSSTALDPAVENMNMVDYYSSVRITSTAQQRIIPSLTTLCTFCETLISLQRGRCVSKMWNITQNQNKSFRVEQHCSEWHWKCETESLQSSQSSWCRVDTIPNKGECI